METIQLERMMYRESGMGEEQTFLWTKATRELRLEDMRNKEKSEQSRILSQSEQTELEQRFRQADVIHWEQVYTTEWLILDGTHWEIRWSESDRNRTSQGSNAYPDGWELLRDWLYRQFEIREEEIR
ncbi:hypothetical protein [Exiguobacterium sp. s166]|uniref:hypothetical protein n=1 Tax=Exiguobacterium sp. s166 TaxID=2751204 RepID=UPI001BE70393|nr:hypothetical protein [Exiguobacterium sp. s166]